MAKKTLTEIVDYELQKTAEQICEKICKYEAERKKDIKEKGTAKNIYEKHCSKCPIIDWYTH